MTRDGLLIVNKPGGMTSHDVVNRFRAILGERRIGHTGTLDPDATGVLVLAVGRATRIIPFLPLDEKEYVAWIVLGRSTDSHDASGRPVGPDRSAETPDKKRLQLVLKRFEGVVEQVPPMVSALKFRGKRLYQLARDGLDVPRKPRKINIKEIELLDYQPPRLRIRLVCSAGTYVRSLAHDLGQALNIGAHLDELTRSRVGTYGLSQALSVDDWTALEQPEFREKWLIPLERALQHLPAWVAPESVVRLLADGRQVGPMDRWEGFPDLPDGLMTVQLESGGLAAVAEKLSADSGETYIKPVRVLLRRRRMESRAG